MVARLSGLLEATEPGLMRAIKKAKRLLGFFDYLIKPFFFRVRRVEVATFSLTFLPSTTRVRFWMFGLKTLRVFLWEKDTLWPYILPLPEISQTAILFLLYSVYDSFEGLWLVNSKVS